MEKQPEKRKQAAALKYDPALDNAPIITALGLGKVAEKIIEKAETSDVPVLENKQLSDILMGLSVGDAIPPKLYEAVAQILIFISQKDNKFFDKIKF
ncbi:MAG: EscU/YscU/HrcU family type III secretion system export apparatus switch protein [Christensenellaceae bacterium]|jgi:flagellar biosynthesis protein